MQKFLQFITSHVRIVHDLVDQLRSQGFLPMHWHGGLATILMHLPMMNNWKSNWPETRQRFLNWWDRKGLVLGMWGHGFAQDAPVHGGIVRPAPAANFEIHHGDPDYVSRRWHAEMAHCRFPADTLPMIRPGPGVVELAAYLGARTTFQEHTLWYESVHADIDAMPPLALDPDNIWFCRMREVMREAMDLADGNYMVGLPAISPGLDVLAELRSTERVMTDFADDPDGVHARLAEIDAIYREVYDCLAEIVRCPDGSIAYYPFMLWGPGRVSQLQCDAAIMISPEMFREFVMPGLRKACAWLDHSLFHVDGPGMWRHLDALLEIGELDAIQFTPGPGVPRGGDAEWWPYYRRILEAGKCVQAVWMSPGDVLPLLNAIGREGVYLMVECESAGEMEELERLVRVA